MDRLNDMFISRHYIHVKRPIRARVSVYMLEPFCVRGLVIGSLSLAPSRGVNGVGTLQNLQRERRRKEPVLYTGSILLLAQGLIGVFLPVRRLQGIFDFDSPHGVSIHLVITQHIFQHFFSVAYITF